MFSDLIERVHRDCATMEKAGQHPALCVRRGKESDQRVPERYGIGLRLIVAERNLRRIEEDATSKGRSADKSSSF